MNRLEFAEMVKAKAVEKGMTLTRVNLYERGDKLSVNVSYVADCRCHWTDEYNVKDLIADLMPIERAWEMQSIHLDRSSSRFKKGDTVEMNSLWVKLRPGEDSPLNSSSAGCGPYREGWLTGTIIEGPEETDHGIYGVAFDRTVYPDPREWIGDVTNLEKMLREGKMQTIEAGFPCYIGAARPEIRALTCEREPVKA